MAVPESSPLITTVSQWQFLLRIIRENQRFFLTGHVRPDGDTVGSELALASLLSRLGKKVEIYNHDPIPNYLQFLPAIESVHTAQRIPPQKYYDVAIFLECSDWKRSGGLIDLSRQTRWVVNIDHHIKAGDYGSVNLINPNVSSNCEQIYTLFEKLRLPLNPKEALCLYTGILTDTGSFQQSNTTPQSHILSARFLRLGVKPAEVSSWIYGNKPIPLLRLHSYALGSLHLALNGKVAIIWLTRKMARQSQLDLEQNHEEIIDYAAKVPGIEVAFLLRELPERNKIKASFRSKGKVDVNEVSKIFGGGGHRNAAGCTLHGKIKDCEQQLLEVLKKRWKLGSV